MEGGGALPLCDISGVIPDVVRIKPREGPLRSASKALVGVEGFGMGVAWVAALFALTKANQLKAA